MRAGFLAWLPASGWQSCYRGASAALAAGALEWLPWAQDPDAAYVFTWPSGHECEMRVVVEQTEDAGDWDAFVANVGHRAADDAAVERSPRRNGTHEA